MRKSQVKPLDEQKAESNNPALGKVGLFLNSSGQNGIGHWLTSGQPLFKLKMLAVAAGLTLSSLAGAVGLGGINVTSSMGQPLQAEIELVAVGREDKPGLVARLASPDAYRGAGIDYPYGVKFNFQIESRSNGQSYLKLNSNKEINDPFVSLLVELSWSSGRLMREYTFLLDPPGYTAAQPESTNVQALAPTVTSQPLPPDEVAPQRETVQPQEESQAIARVAKPVERPVEKRAISVPAKQPKREAVYVPTEEVEVFSGDSLSKIAARVKSDDVSLERMLVALYRANSDQFDDENMNRIRSGKILRMPDQDELMEVSQSEAVQEIRTQAADWNAYRQKLASAASFSGQSDASRQVASGKITSSAVDKTPVASESAKEVLRLSKGEAPGDKSAGSGHGASEQDKLNSAAEDAIAKSKADSEEQARLALLENNLKDMERLAQLKSEAAALAAAASGVAASGVMAEPVPASAVEPVVQEGPSLIDELMDYQMELGIGAAALLALGGLGVALRRRQRGSGKPTDEQVDLGATTMHLSVPPVSSPETGDFTSLVDHAEDIIHQEEDVDPISEAELFLNFGRDEQAEEVLIDALKYAPDNHKLHLKLLGIYANRKDLKSFESIARKLHETDDEDAIQQANAMGRQIDPSNPLYADPNAPVADAPADDADSAVMLNMMRAALDGEHDAASDEAVLEKPDEADEVMPLEEEAVESDGTLEAMDFDVTELYSPSTKEGEIDFDVTSTSPSIPAASSLDFDISALGLESETEEEPKSEEVASNMDDLIFDVMPPSTSRPEEAELVAEPESEPEPKQEFEVDIDFGDEKIEEAPAGKTDSPDEAMDFILDFPMDDVQPKSQPLAPAINLSDISLEMDDVEAESAMAPESTVDSLPVMDSEHWQDVATKLDLARAYQEMGDAVGAREILDEVMLEGDEGQRNEAQSLIDQLG